MNKSLLLLLVLVCVGAGAYIYKEERTIARLRRTLESHQLAAQQITGDHERAKAEVAELKRSNEVFKNESADLRRQLADKGGNSTIPTAQADAQKSGGGFMKNFAKMFTDPEMKKSMRVQQMVGIRMMYSDLTKELGLSAQETEQLLEILADRQMDLSAASMAALDGGDKDAQATKITDATKRYDEQLKAVLGEDKYKQMKTYETSMGDRWMMQQWDGQFAAAGSPLEAKQKDQLLALIADERQKSPAGSLNFGGAGGDASKALQAMQTEDGIKQLMASQQAVNQRVLNRARDFLNADQVVTLEKAQKQQLELMTMQIKMSREFMSGGGK